MVETSFGSLRGVNSQQLVSGQSAIAFIRPEAISVIDGESSFENSIQCSVENISFEGPFATVYLKTNQNEAFVLRQSNDGSTPFLEVGAKIEVGFDAENTRLLTFEEVTDA